MSEALRKARERAGLSAFVLAQKAGTTEPRIYIFERDRHGPHPDEAARIARVLGEPVEKLFPNLRGK